ncbi:MAG: hypothetical protein ACT4PU_09600 [Planctomycetota bacterium]
MTEALRRPALAILVLVVLAAGFFQLHNYDMHLHARTGEWIVAHGEVPSTNVLSRLHASYPDVQDKWGFQVLAHGLFDGLGPDACIALRMLVLLGLFLLLHDTARRLGAAPFWSLGLLLLALVAARSRFAFRPDLFSLLFTALVARALLVEHRDGRGAAWLVALQVVWVNTHGYFIMGPLMVATAAGAALLAGPAARRQALRLLLLAAVMALACLLNPAGWDGVLHPKRILDDLSQHEAFYQEAIIEFRPPFAADPRQPYDRLAYFVLGGLAALLLSLEALLVLRRQTTPASRHAACLALALLLLFGAMSLSIRRNMAPFALMAAPLAAAAATRRFPLPRGLRAPAAVLPVMLAGLIVFGELSDRTSIHDDLDRRAGGGISRIAYPDAGIAFIARHLPRASVFTAFRYGSTFTGRRWPEQAAALDGNTHGYPTAYLIECMSALSGSDPEAFQRLADRDGHDVALLPLAGPLSLQLSGDLRWVLVHLGVREAVWARRSALSPAFLLEHDLLARWRAGEPVELPNTPCDEALLGIPRRCVPLAELDQATLLLAAGLLPAALARAEAAQQVDPEGGEPLCLAGLVSWRQGEVERARELIGAGLARPGFNRLAAEVLPLLESR